LRKPDKLTPEERDVMQTHVWIGFNILSGIAPLGRVAEIVLAHHERWDGRGYPQRLQGENIPHGARIFAIADTLDAMTTDRPYRRALPLAAAYAEIQRESGKQFDPRVVEAFLGMPEEFIRQIVLQEKPVA
jgi:putative two-component system response regulator